MTALPLPAKLDLAQAATLAKAIRAESGGDLALDASGVTLLGGLGLQILASAAQSWRTSGHRLTISPRSEAFDEALAIFGVDLATLQSEEAA